MSRDPVPFPLAPNDPVPNSRLPALLYRTALPASASVIESTFNAHAWRNAWIGGIYPFHHFHTTSHEVLGCAGGTASVRIGGEAGQDVEIGPGDVLVLPAGVGHKRLAASPKFQVVGAYPGGAAWDLVKAEGLTVLAYAEAQRRIAAVSLPRTDPVFGVDGPLVRLWKQASQAEPRA